MNAILSAWSEGKIKNAVPKIIISSSKENASALEAASKKYGIRTEIVKYHGSKIKDDYIPDNSISKDWVIQWKSNPDIQHKLRERWERYDKKIFELMVDCGV